MLDPLDPSLVRSLDTDARLQAGDYPGDLADQPPLARPAPPLVQHNRCELVLDAAIANGASTRVTSDTILPTDWWVIAVSNTASTTLAVYPGGIAAGLAARLGPGGLLKLPCRDHNTLQLVAGATGPAAVNVWILDGITVQWFTQLYSSS